MKKNKGFTLLEMVVYAGILGIMVIAISSYFLWSIKGGTKAMVMRETLDNTRRAMEIMVYEIREAESVYLPTSSFGSHPGQISLEMKKYLPYDEETTYVDFFISNGKLCLKKESQSSVCFTSDRVEISNLVFTQIESSGFPSVQIELIADYKNPTNKPEREAQVSLTSTASPRSY
ncbi:PilW family protein [Patescibacteria group bacterium]